MHPMPDARFASSHDGRTVLLIPAASASIIVDAIIQIHGNTKELKFRRGSHRCDVDAGAPNSEDMRTRVETGIAARERLHECTAGLDRAFVAATPRWYTCRYTQTVALSKLESESEACVACLHVRTGGRRGRPRFSFRDM